jgi:hypothetical protein
MSTCTSCGQPLSSEGRFCGHCGAPVTAVPPSAVPPSAEPAAAEDWRTTTAERPAVGPRTPPSAVAPPPPPRYPLYADEVDDWTPYGPLVSTEPAPLTPAEPVEAQPISAGTWEEVEPEPAQEEPAYEEPVYEEWEDEDTGRRSPLLWVLATVAVLAVLGAGWWFLARDTSTDDAPPTAGDSAGPSANAADPVDVAADATAEAPETAQPNQDVNGERTTYDAANMLDGDPATTWRAPGATDGMTLTFTLAGPTELTQVGLVNGYAKTGKDGDRELDWYAGNRRVKAVVWGFDGGVKVRQQLKDTRDLQTLEVDPVTTSTVTLKIVRVTEPGSGPASRDFTAISEVSLSGVPQS